MVALFIAISLSSFLHHQASSLGSMVGFAFLILLAASIAITIASSGWNMFWRWDRVVVEQFAEIQALITAIALAEIAGLFWPHASTLVGVLAFLLLRRPLRHLFLHVLNMPPEHSRHAVEMAMRPDVSGTPWQDNPSHTR
jgi:hypothetical protein